MSSVERIDFLFCSKLDLWLKLQQSSLSKINEREIQTRSKLLKVWILIQGAQVRAYPHFPPPSQNLSDPYIYHLRKKKVKKLREYKNDALPFSSIDSVHILSQGVVPMYFEVMNYITSNHLFRNMKITSPWNYICDQWWASPDGKGNLPGPGAPESSSLIR